MPSNESDDVCYMQPRTTPQRIDIAKDFVERFHYDIPLLVDPNRGRGQSHLRRVRERLYVVEGRP